MDIYALASLLCIIDFTLSRRESILSLALLMAEGEFEDFERAEVIPTLMEAN